MGVQTGQIYRADIYHQNIRSLISVLRTRPENCRVKTKYSTNLLIRTPFIRKSCLTKLFWCLPYFGFVVYRVQWAIIGDFNKILTKSLY